MVAVEKDLRPLSENEEEIPGHSTLLAQIENVRVQTIDEAGSLRLEPSPNAPLPL